MEGTLCALVIWNIHPVECFAEAPEHKGHRYEEPSVLPTMGELSCAELESSYFISMRKEGYKIKKTPDFHISRLLSS